MYKKNRAYAIAAVLIAASLAFSACGTKTASSDAADSGSAVSASSAIAGEQNTAEIKAFTEQIDMSAWLYNEENDVYYQVGITYCENPADDAYENMGIYVPGKYFTATDNGDGTFTCTLDETATVGNYTAATAPMVIPVNTPGYSAMNAPTGYANDVSAYTAEGYVYIYAGCRGRDAGAPAGVTDLKAAIRYIRSNGDILPGDEESIFSFGMSGGGAQSALLGSTGDSSLYDSYLEAIGAVMDRSDAVAGAMCWCPITSLDVADEAYEWNLGVTRSNLSEDEQSLSDDLATEFAKYINDLQLRDTEGNVLALEESEDGIYQAGSYYEYVKGTIEESLENFINDTEWPYTAASQEMGPGGDMGGKPDGEAPADMGEKPDGEAPADMGEKPDGEAPADMGEKPDGEAPADMGEKPDGEAPADMGDLPNGDVPTDIGEKPDSEASANPGNVADDKGQSGTDNTNGAASDSEEAAQYAADDISRSEGSAGLSLDGTYETAADYIAALNTNLDWVSYDESTGQVSISSVADFVSQCKNASKSLGAFDQLDEGQGENTLFGYGDGEGAHFDSILGALLESNDYGTDYAAAYAEDLQRTDEEGNTVATRVNMYNPLYYLCNYYEGAGSANVAKYWRIRTGINQSDTALTTEINLSLALEAAGCDVDFATVWGQGHTQAERTGSASENFIQWVNDCMQA